MAKKMMYGGRWTDFMRRGGLALAALGIIMMILRVNHAISLYFIFGGVASWLAGKTLKAES